MSNRMRAAYAVVPVLLVAAATGAAQGSRYYFGVGGGLTVPTGEFATDANGDGFKTGWQGMALVHFALPRFGVRLEATYGENSANDQLKADLSAAVGAPTDAKTKLLGGSVDLTYEFPTWYRAKAYVLTGIGVYNTKLSVTSGNVTADTSKTKLALNAGIGVVADVGRAVLFLEARYFAISEPFGFGSDVKYFPIIAGLRFGGS